MTKDQLAKCTVYKKWPVILLHDLIKAIVEGDQEQLLRLILNTYMCLQALNAPPGLAQCRGNASTGKNFGTWPKRNPGEGWEARSVHLFVAAIMSLQGRMTFSLGNRRIAARLQP